MTYYHCRKWSKWLITAVMEFSHFIAQIEGNVTSRHARSRTPAMMMLAAILRRRIKSDGVITQGAVGFTLIELSMGL